MKHITAVSPTSHRLAKNFVLELHNLYASPNIRVIKPRMMRWAGHVACMTDVKCIQNLAWETEGKRSLGIPSQ
jgi:hypothetical protein